MKVTLNKWGNSIGIRIPKKLLESINLKLGDTLSISTQGNKIILSSNRVSLNCLDCDTEMKSTGTINKYYEYECPNCNSLIRLNNKRH